MSPLLLQAAADTLSGGGDVPSGYGLALTQTLLALLGVCVLAWATLRWAAQRGLGPSAGARMRVLERVALDARRSLWLVEVPGKVLVVGSGDSGAPTVLAELPPEAAKALPAAPTRSFAEVLRGTVAARGSDAEPPAS